MNYLQYVVGSFSNDEVNKGEFSFKNSIVIWIYTVLCIDGVCALLLVWLLV